MSTIERFVRVFETKTKQTKIRKKSDGEFSTIFSIHVPLALPVAADLMLKTKYFAFSTKKNGATICAQIYEFLKMKY